MHTYNENKIVIISYQITSEKSYALRTHTQKKIKHIHTNNSAPFVRKLQHFKMIV